MSDSVQTGFLTPLHSSACLEPAASASDPLHPESPTPLRSPGCLGSMLLTPDHAHLELPVPLRSLGRSGHCLHCTALLEWKEDYMDHAGTHESICVLSFARTFGTDLGLRPYRQSSAHSKPGPQMLRAARASCVGDERTDGLFRFCSS